MIHHVNVLLLTSAAAVIAMTDVNGLSGVCSVYGGADEQPSNDFKVNRNKIRDERVSAEVSSLGINLILSASIRLIQTSKFPVHTEIELKVNWSISRYLLLF